MNKKKSHPHRRAIPASTAGRWYLFANAVRQLIAERKRMGACVACGAVHTKKRPLTFHHRDPRHKEFDLGAAVQLNLNVSDVEREMAKCDLYCRPCHEREDNRLRQQQRDWSSIQAGYKAQKETPHE